MITGTLITDELHLCNLMPMFHDIRGWSQMGYISGGTRATDPELDEALARAIRQLIAEAIEAGASAGSAAAEPPSAVAAA